MCWVQQIDCLDGEIKWKKLNYPLTNEKLMGLYKKILKEQVKFDIEDLEIEYNNKETTDS